MHGLVNRAIEGLLCSRFGEGAWRRIQAAACAELHSISRVETYPDQLTYDLIAAASSVTGHTPEELLRLIGQHWIQHTAAEGYGDLLEGMGETLGEFLANLNEIHGRVALLFDDIEPPVLTLVHRSDDEMELHYSSHRAGLAPMVIGMIEALAERFGTSAEVVLAAEREGGAEVFRIRVLEEVRR